MPRGQKQDESQQQDNGDKPESLLKAFQACMQSFMISVNQRIDNFIIDMNTKVTELKVSLEYTQAEVEDVKKKVANSVKDSERIQKFEDSMAETLKTIDYLENQSRRCNLRIDGLKEESNESWEETEKQFREMLTNRIDMSEAEVSNIDIERIHRTGPSKSQSHSGKPRQIVAKFTRFKDRELVLKKVKEVKPQGIYINEDYSPRVVAKRKELTVKMKELRSEGKTAYLSFDKLIVKDKHTPPS